MGKRRRAHVRWCLGCRGLGTLFNWVVGSQEGARGCDNAACLLEEAPGHCNSWTGSWGTGNSVQRGLEKHSLEARNVCPFSRQI